MEDSLGREGMNSVGREPRLPHHGNTQIKVQWSSFGLPEDGSVGVNHLVT